MNHAHKLQPACGDQASVILHTVCRQVFELKLVQVECLESWTSWWGYKSGRYIQLEMHNTFDCLPVQLFDPSLAICWQLYSIRKKSNVRLSFSALQLNSYVNKTRHCLQLSSADSTVNLLKFQEVLRPSCCRIHPFLHGLHLHNTHFLHDDKHFYLTLHQCGLCSGNTPSVYITAGVFVSTKPASKT